MLLVLSLVLSGSSPGSGSGLGFNPTPDPSQLPGFNVLQHLTDGVEGWALIAAVVGVVVGAILWAFGHYSQNYQQAYNGRRGVMVSALAAVLIGGAPHIVSFFLGQGNGLS
jgi:type IV secretory pathway VirB2 component (pilin)